MAGRELEIHLIILSIKAIKEWFKYFKGISLKNEQNLIIS